MCTSLSFQVSPRLIPTNRSIAHPTISIFKFIYFRLPPSLETVRLKSAWASRVFAQSVRCCLPLPETGVGIALCGRPPSLSVCPVVRPSVVVDLGDDVDYRQMLL